MVDFMKAEILFEPVPPKIIIYGTNGIGKSRFAMQAPKAIFLDFDKNLSQYPVITNKSKGINCPLETFQQVIDFLTLLINEPHDFKSIIIDTFSSLNMIIENQVKLEKNVESIKAIPYGVGYSYTKVLWEQILRKLDFLWEKRKMMIILLGHDAIKETQDPINGNFDGYVFDLHKDTGSMFLAWCSVILYATTMKRFKEEKSKFGNINKKLADSKRVLYTEGDDLFKAKNTYGLPAILPFDDVEAAWTIFYNHIKSHYDPKTESPASKIEPQTKPTTPETKGDK